MRIVVILSNGLVLACLIYFVVFIERFEGAPPRDFLLMFALFFVPSVSLIFALRSPKHEELEQLEREIKKQELENKLSTLRKENTA